MLGTHAIIDTVNTTNVQPPTVIERKADIPTNINNHHTNNQNNTTTVNQNNGAPNSGNIIIAVMVFEYLQDLYRTFYHLKIKAECQ
jgi:hypothetical protein